MWKNWWNFVLKQIKGTKTASDFEESAALLRMRFFLKSWRLDHRIRIPGIFKPISVLQEQEDPRKKKQQTNWKKRRSHENHKKKLPKERMSLHHLAVFNQVLNLIKRMFFRIFPRTRKPWNLKAESSNKLKRLGWLKKRKFKNTGLTLYNPSNSFLTRWLENQKCNQHQTQNVQKYTCGPKDRNCVSDWSKFSKLVRLSTEMHIFG